MKILVVTQYYYPEPFRINEICEELECRGHNVTVLTTNPNYPDGEIYEGYDNVESFETINGVKVIRCKSRPRHKGAVNLARNYISFMLSANKKVKQIKDDFDCIYVYQLSPITSCVPAIRVKKRKNIPVLLYCLDIWPESLKGSAFGSGPVFEFFKVFSKKVYRSADVIAVTSPSFIDYISNLSNIDKSRMVTIYQHAGEINSEPKTDVNFNIYNQYINFMFVGNVGESQNLECIVKAINNAEKKEKIRFHIVGSGSYLDNLKSLVERYGIKDLVIFHGRHPKSELGKYYSFADVCIVALKNEGIVSHTIPGKVQEYMSTGKPVLACMNGDTMDVITKANCGICVDTDDEIKLAKAIDYLVENKDDLVEMGRNARKYYINNFTLRHHVDILEMVLNRIVEGKIELKAN
jgi:glycosyltransferase involved in cell wall biosynthesis